MTPSGLFESVQNHARIAAIALGMTVAATGPARSQVASEPIPACDQVPPQPASLEGAQTQVYKTVRNSGLRLYIFNPEQHSTESKDAAIVFFFGGAWSLGNVDQFLPQARDLAERGMVAILADYRVLCRQRSTLRDSMADALDAVHYVRSHASKLGIDPDRIAAGGTSAGGHLALSTALFNGVGEVRDGVSSQPNALVLFSPGIDLTTDVIAKIVQQNFGSREAKRLAQISPMQQPTSTIPTLIQVGDDDALTPVRIAKDYCGRALEGGAICRVVGYPSANHNFFFPQIEDGKWYQPTLAEAEKFLQSLGFLKK